MPRLTYNQSTRSFLCSIIVHIQIDTTSVCRTWKCAENVLCDLWQAYGAVQPSSYILGAYAFVTYNRSTRAASFFCFFARWLLTIPQSSLTYELIRRQSVELKNALSDLAQVYGAVSQVSYILGAFAFVTYNRSTRAAIITVASFFCFFARCILTTRQSSFTYELTWHRSVEL